MKVNQQTGFVLDGHLRVALAIREGQPTVPVEYLDLTPAEEALALASIDPISAMAGTDSTLLGELLAEIVTENADVLAFLDGLRDEHGIARDPTEGLTDPDAVPEVPAEPITRLGDLWTLGAHRLLCADSTDPEALSVLTGGDVDLIVTDPPYGVDYVGKTKDALTLVNDQDNDAATRAQVAAFLQAATLRAGGAFYVFAPAGRTELAFRLAIEDAGHELRQALVWVKQQFVMGRQDYHWQHESILYGWRDGAAHYFVPDRTLNTVIDDDLDLKKLSKAELLAIAEAVQGHQTTSVLREDRPHRSELHPTIKPVALYRRLIENSSRPGERVLDGFAGSGTAAIAAEMTGRRAFMCEIDPRYCDVAVQRWEDFTGQTATRVPAERAA